MEIKEFLKKQDLMEVSGDESMVYVGSPCLNFVKEYVQKYDNDFYEPLSSRVNIDSFAQKLSDLSTCFLLFERDVLAGMICAYFYQQESGKGYITLTHTKKEFRGAHVAKRLLDAVRSYAKDRGFIFVDLAVYNENVSAYNLYLHYGFTPLSNNGVRSEMRLTL